jgi:Flp pilus assembly protein TadD
VAANNLSWLLAETGGDLNEALNLARIAKRKLPDSARVTDTLGWVYYRQGSFQSAIQTLKESVRLDSKNPVYHFHLGMSYFKAGDKANAKVSLSEALRLSPNFSGADEARSTMAKL